MPAMLRQADEQLEYRGPIEEREDQYGIKGEKHGEEGTQKGWEEGERREIGKHTGMGEAISKQRAVQIRHQSTSI